VKKEEPDAAQPKQEPMETEEKKPEMKTEPKEEEESGANGTSTTSSPQSRKKSKNTEAICVYKACHNMVWYYTLYTFKKWRQKNVSVFVCI